MSTALDWENSVIDLQGADHSASASKLVPGEHATIQSAQYYMMVRSKLNVRRKSSSIGELAALIRSQGLLQTLVGFDQVAGGVATGMVEIVAGATP